MYVHPTMPRYTFTAHNNILTVITLLLFSLQTMFLLYESPTQRKTDLYLGVLGMCVCVCRN